jgi:gliding motility-associated-like protein
MNLRSTVSVAFFALCVFRCDRIFAQSDCESAVSVCNMVYDENDSPSGTGNVIETGPGSCQTGGEFNSAWYIFSPQSDGALTFSIEPNDLNDDYDWSVFDITDGGCAGINSGASPEVSCNSYGTFSGPPGQTGISSAMGGVGSSNGPGDALGPPFNEDLLVSAGSVYALVVMNYSQTLNGYNLDFGTSEVEIFDETAPAVSDYSYSWCDGVLEIEFDEAIYVANLSAADFVFSPLATITDFSTPDPNYSNVIQLTLDAGSIAAATISLSTASGDALQDLCGNAVIEPLNFNMELAPILQVSTTPACNDIGGSLTATVINSDPLLFTFVVDNATVNSFPLQNLSSGNHDVSAIDAAGCSIDTVVSISNQLATLTTPADTSLCDLNGQFTLSGVSGNILWSSDDAVSFSNPNGSSCSISTNLALTATIDVTATNSDCVSSGSFEVTFNYPPLMYTEITDATCHDVCDGSITVTNGNPENFQVSLNFNSQTGNEVTFDQLCAGEFQLEISHSAACETQYVFSVSEPPPVNAEFTATPRVVMTDHPLVILTSTATNADSLYWTLESESYILSYDSSWVYTLPEIPGEYPVQLTVFDANGCRDDYVMTIYVEDYLYFYLPSAFTPDADGINDVFKPLFNIEPKNYSLQIFNRDGEKVFHSVDPNEFWLGGRLQGDYFCPNGIYLWKLSVSDPFTGEVNERNGHILLTR